MSSEKRFYILTDTHYVSKRIYTGNSGIRGREKGDQIALIATPEITRSFFKIFLEDKDSDSILITGDLVNGGDRASHEDFIEELNKLKAAGKRVFVTTATHDYCGMGEDENGFRAVRYTENGAEETECVRKAELLPMYYDFGPAQSDSVHEESGSYSLKLFDGVRLIAINDNGNGRSHCGLFDDGFAWLENEIDKANAAGERVLLATHHPVLSPWDIYGHLVNYELFGGYERLCKIMCEKNVRVVFTGHTHVQNIRKYTDEQGRYFYDVATTAAPASYGKMRLVQIDDSLSKCEISSIGIDKIEGYDTGDKSATEYIYGLNFIGLLDNNLHLLKTDYKGFVDAVDGFLPRGQLEAHPHLWKTLLGIAQGVKLKSLAKLGKKYNGMSRAEIKALGDKKFMPAVIKVAGSSQKGNGPYPPETEEYKVVTGMTKLADSLNKKLKIKALDKLIPEGETLTEVLEPLLYNNRTGDDDNIIIEF